MFTGAHHLVPSQREECSPPWPTSYSLNFILILSSILCVFLCSLSFRAFSNKSVSSSFPKLAVHMPGPTDPLWFNLPYRTWYWLETSKIKSVPVFVVQIFFSAPCSWSLSLCRSVNVRYQYHAHKECQAGLLFCALEVLHFWIADRKMRFWIVC